MRYTFISVIVLVSFMLLLSSQMCICYDDTERSIRYGLFIKDAIKAIFDHRDNARRIVEERRVIKHVVDRDAYPVPFTK